MQGCPVTYVPQELPSHGPSSPWETIWPPLLSLSLDICSGLPHSKNYPYLHTEATQPSFTSGLYVIKSSGFSNGTPCST